MLLSSRKLIEFISSADTIVAPYFRGLYTVDQLLDDAVNELIDLNSQNCVIVHSNDHYVGIYLNTQQDKSAFVDSLDNDPSTYSDILEVFLDQYAPRYDTVPFTLQSESSHLCGQYAVMLLHQLCSGQSLDSACRVFKAGANAHNDKVLRTFFMRNFSAKQTSMLFS